MIDQLQPAEIHTLEGLFGVCSLGPVGSITPPVPAIPGSTGGVVIPDLGSTGGVVIEPWNPQAGNLPGLVQAEPWS